MLQPSTLQFLKDLKNHNERPWFQENKDRYLSAKADFEQFIQLVLLELTKIDPDYSNLRVKDCVFRIYRDVRFSKDKTPYKIHFAAGISKHGKKVHFPGMHIHVEPGNTYVGGGIWRPDKEMLYKIRQEIDYNLDDFLKIIRKPSFEKKFGSLSVQDKLKRPPKGYEKDNTAIEYLKLKSFIVQQKMEMEKVASKDFVKEVIEIFEELNPFLKFIEFALDG